MSKFLALTIALGFMVVTVPAPVYAQQQDKCYKFCQQRCTSANIKANCENQCMGKCMSQRRN
jgi:hypothetical protein